ncbi:hypothetical protein DESC_370212 [Desulfosarcina cetonica]|nr:hypothetical protein DESC_370212 [Desulfosarcina cetonica]
MPIRSGVNHTAAVIIENDAAHRKRVFGEALGASPGHFGHMRDHVRRLDVEGVEGVAGGVSPGHRFGQCAIGGQFKGPAGKGLQGQLGFGRMGVGNVLGHLHRFAEKDRQGRRLKTARGRGGQGHLEEVADLDKGHLGQVRPEGLGEALAAAAGGQHQTVDAGSLGHVHGFFDGGHIGVMGHGPHDAGGAQNRDAADHTQTGVEGFAGQALSLGHENLHVDIPIRGMACRYFLDAVDDHGPWAWGDGRLTGFDLESRQGYPTHTDTAGDAYGWRAGRRFQAHTRADLGTVGSVRVVAGILDDRAGGRNVVFPLTPVHADGCGGAGQKPDRHGFGRLAGKEQEKGRLGGGRRCRTCRETGFKLCGLIFQCDLFPS